APEEVQHRSYWVAENRDIVLEPVSDSYEQLQALLDLYWRGTQYLLPFFPKSALAYVENLNRNSDPEKALRAARDQWEGSEYQRGYPERDDAYYRLAFRDADPLDEQFVELALAVFEPLLGHARQPVEDG
ncbi:MAG: exodeoxyribonuclease V subunit gamma, partial [Phycisphaerales bacterium]|nr:exodeoxyribonuclease V subunit gamma [Phycisphaerales bacterium]